VTCTYAIKVTIYSCRSSSSRRERNIGSQLGRQQPGGEEYGHADQRASWGRGRL
jgi:hypothetical protein